MEEGWEDSLAWGSGLRRNRAVLDSCLTHAIAKPLGRALELPSARHSPNPHAPALCSHHRCLTIRTHPVFHPLPNYLSSSKHVTCATLPFASTPATTQSKHGWPPSPEVVAAVEAELRRLSAKQPALPWNASSRGSRKKAA